MTREEHLKFCKKCIYRKPDMKVGLICNLTNEIANFENECSSYQLDKAVIERMDDAEAVHHSDILNKLSERDLDRFKAEENYPKALIVGSVVGLFGAILWASITIATEYQIGFMAIAIGAGIGFSMRYFGKGIDNIFGITGAVIAILCCLLGNFFSMIGFAANAEGMGYLDVLAFIDYSLVIPIMVEAFSPMDLFFYAIAAYEGYKFSFRTFTEKELYDLENKKLS
ncbi:cation:proton antiporter family protein [Confluentibacter lentus]|uniref:hypothetical protein n=1 Tax=Confluentibacter lentus TaxID=1699412 RepID=UPI000C2832CD|nr:hypothetical protein [Confluentibacter lentus]